MVNPNEMVNHFAAMANDSLAEFNVVEGQVIYLAGSVLVPIEENRPYDFRLKFLGTFVIDGHITVSDAKKMFYVDPDNIEMLSEEDEKPYMEIRDEDFPQVKQDIMADEETA